MVRSFRHKGLQKFFETESKAGIQPKHATKLLLQFTVLNAAELPDEMDIASWEWHALKGVSHGRWAVKVNGNWRLTFGFEGRDAILMDYEDYH